MRGESIGGETLTHGEADKVFHVGPPITIEAMAMVVGEMTVHTLNSPLNLAQFEPAHSFLVNQVVHFRQPLGTTGELLHSQFAATQ